MLADGAIHMSPIDPAHTDFLAGTANKRSGQKQVPALSMWDETSVESSQVQDLKP